MSYFERIERGFSRIKLIKTDKIKTDFGTDFYSCKHETKVFMTKTNKQEHRNNKSITV
jgi:hypothetical protein